MKYYVVSDTHSFYTETIQALTKKGFFTDTQPHKLIICGDIFDRGGESKEMQDFILDLLKKDEVILIRGNHEDLFLELTEHANKWFDKDIFYTHHARNGTIRTVMDLTGVDEIDLLNPEKMSALIKETPYYKTIIPKMVDYFETSKYIFVHGWIPCEACGYGGKAKIYHYIKNWRESNALDWNYARWYNGMDAWWQGVIEEGKCIFCGHWHTSFGHSRIRNEGMEFGPTANFTPFADIGIWAIDGCVAVSGKVNCVVIEDD